MNPSLKRLGRAICILALILCVTVLSFAQQAVVTRNANLRRDPSTQQAPIRKLIPPDVVELLEPNQTNGYYHVRTQDDEEGWVYGQFLRILSPSEPVPDSPATAAGPPPASAAAATSISSDWEKPTQGPTTFGSGGQTCGPTGDSDDADTNLLKNRTDSPPGYHEVTFDAIAGLPYPSPAPKHRHDWSEAQLAVIKPFEGVAVTVVGYIVAIKPQTGGSGESTNCHWTHASEVDWHIALTKELGQGEKEAVVVETTPRVRKSRPKWTTTRLAPWKNSDAPVRISGWLMLDPEHRNHLGKYRSTLWEIHPIMKIEVFKDGQWTALEQLP